MRSSSLICVEQWHVWVPDQGVKVPVDFISPNVRRRLSSLSKMALYVSHHCVGDAVVDYGVFCSRHGELKRSHALLEDVVAKVALSPIAFSQSVHNTASGLFSILRKDQQPTTSIAAGVDSFLSGFIDAVAFLRLYPDSKVLLVCFDEDVPDFYEDFRDASMMDYAVAFLLSSRSDGQQVSFEVVPRAKDVFGVVEKPQALRFLDWWQGVGRSFVLDGRVSSVCWERV